MGRSSTSFSPGRSGNPSRQFSSNNQPKHDRTLPRNSYKAALEAAVANTDWDKMNLDPEVRQHFIETFGDDGMKAIAYAIIGKALQGDLRAAKIIMDITG